MSNTHILQRIYDTIESRQHADPAHSYTAGLLAKGTKKIAEKVSEEATETIIEAVTNNKEKLGKESADLLFHLLVLWFDAGLKPDEVFDILEARLAIKNLDEIALQKVR